MQAFQGTVSNVQGAVANTVNNVANTVTNTVVQSVVDPEVARREGCTKPGHLIYSAKMDQEKLECFYGWCMCMCCSKQTMARRTVVDIYTNGIHTNVPCGVACCCWQDSNKYIFFDDPRFMTGLTMGKAGCCTPFPWLCPHACGCCGDVMYMYRCCPTGCGFSNCPLGIGHASMCGGFFGLFALCVTDLICGMKENEPMVVDQVVTSARNGTALPCVRAPHMPMVPTAMGVQTAAVPQQAYAAQGVVGQQMVQQNVGAPMQ